MALIFRKICFTFVFNSFLFLILIIGIQNSNNKSKVDLLINKTISLPIGFIIGTSFISGSILGSFFPIFLNEKE